MAGSVAGQIRIDLLANVAQFNAGMRSAGKDGLGGLQQEFDRTVRGFDSKKSVAARLANDRGYWNQAMEGPAIEIARMRDGGKAYADTVAQVQNSLANSYSEPKARSNQARWKSMLPWGNTMRTEMSREAALSAAEIGRHNNNLRGLLLDGAHSLGGGMPGVGSALSAIGRFGMSPLGMVAGLAIGAAAYGAHRVSSHNRLAREVEDSSEQIGQGAMDTSKLLGAGFDVNMLSKFQKSIANQSAEQQEAFKKLGLNPDDLGTKPLIDSLGLVRDAFDDKIKNSADRASIAMRLLGKSGATVIHTLAEMKINMDLMGDFEIVKPEDLARVKAYDHAMKGLGNVMPNVAHAMGMKAGLGTELARQFEIMGKLATFDFRGAGKAMDRQRREDYNIDHAAEIEAAKVKQDALNVATERYADAWTKAGKALSDTLGRLQAANDDLRFGEGTADRKKFAADAYKEAQAWKKSQENERDRILSEGGTWSVGLSKTEFDKKYSDLDYRANVRASRTMDEYDSQVADTKLLKKNAKDESDAESLMKGIQTPKDKYREEVARAEELFSLNKLNEDQLAVYKQKCAKDYYNAEKAERSKALDERFRDEDTIKKRLGIKDPLGDYQKAIGRLRDAKDRGEITGDEYDKHRKKLRQTAVGEMMSDQKSVTPIAAMQAGSREAYSLLVNAQLNDPKVQLAKQSLTKLDQIEKHLRATVAATETLDF